MPHQIIYSSQAVTPLSMSDLEQILVDARVGNERRQVSGVLVYVDGVFVQILEGEEAVLRDLIQRIAADARHTGMKVFYEGQVGERTFPDWKMAYLNATPQQMAAWAGLEGAARSIESILQDMHQTPGHIPQVIENLLTALKP